MNYYGMESPRLGAAETVALTSKLSIAAAHGLSGLSKWILEILEWIFGIFLLVSLLEKVIHGRFEYRTIYRAPLEYRYLSFVPFLL